MNTGMLWFDDNSQTTITVKIQHAVDYYVKKYGRKPNLCFVHPSVLDGQPPEIEGLTVLPYHPVLPGHIWVGMADVQS